MAIGKIKKNIFGKLRNKYRLVVMNDETLEERVSFRLSRMNVYILLSTILMVLIFLILLTIVLTPLKEYIPGYGDLQFRKDLEQIREHTDSLDRLVYAQDAYINNIRKILVGDMRNDSISQIKVSDSTDYSNIDIEKVSEKDSLLRAEVEEQLRYTLTGVSGSQENDPVLTHLFAPLIGPITSDFEPENDHFGIDIVAPADSPIKSVLPGTVIIANWTLETGYVIAVQHSNNLISFYKHNSVLLKKVGNFVDAGDVLAIIGNSGELSTGPHLHFELWRNKIPVNPKDYISFN